MQKGKHQGGQTQGFSHRSYPVYPGNPDTSRHYTREVPAFHASGTPGGGSGMRGAHHAPPTQPPTPPTSQDIKQPPTHLPPQSHPMPPQSGGLMYNTMTGAGRSNSQQAPFFNTQRGPSGVQRMPLHQRTAVMMNNPQSYIPQPAVQQVYQSSLVSPVSGQPSVYVAPHMNQSFQLQAQSRHQATFYPPQPFVVPQPHPLFPSSYPQVYYTPQIQPMSRPGGTVPNSQTGAPHPSSTGMVITGTSGTMVSPPSAVEMPKQVRPKAVKIIHPDDGRNILDEVIMDNNSSSKSGKSAKQGSQTNSDQKTDQGVAAEFATRVAIVARSDQTGSSNSTALQQQQQQPSSRASNYSENESQASPDVQGVSPSKLDISVESIPSESQIVENNMTYDPNQQATMMRPGWPQVMTQVELMPVQIHSPLIMSDDLMIGGAPPAQPPREYQSLQTQWIPDTNAVPVSVIISKEPSAPLESPARPGPERVTPVVSALAHGPTVEIGPRHPREQFPALGKGHQQPSPVKRKHRVDASQEQTEGKNKDPQPQQQPPQQVSQQQQPLQPAKASAQKPKQATPTVESKKQSSPPSQDSEDYVQSLQTRTSETKTVSNKVNEADNSETKVKSNDSLVNKENNNLETRNLNEEIIQDSNNRNKSEAAKSEVVVLAENISLPRTEECSDKYRGRMSDETREVQKEQDPEVVNVHGQGDEQWEAAEPVGRWKLKQNGETTETLVETHVEGETSTIDSTQPESKQKANGETIPDDAKQNNQKQKPGNKRQAQSKMRLEKEAWSPEQSESLANEVIPDSAPPVPEAKSPPPPAPVNSGQPEEAELQEETAADEETEKEKEDLIVAAKNEENTKQTASLKTNDSANSSSVIENVNKVILKHNYKKGQWSPLNQDGKKKYDRDFIMELMDEPQSRRRPTGLPNLDLLKDNTKQRPSDRNFLNTLRDSENSLYPNFGNKNPIQRNSQILQKKGSQTSKSKVTKHTVIHMSLHQDVKLRETENAWKPARNSNYNNMTDEEIKTDELYRRVRGVLNKLTPEKFSTLVDQLRVLPIDNHTRLKGVINLVFEKAVDEPSFSVAYAQMCNNIQNIEVPSGEYDADGKPIFTTFKKLLLSRCQVEFEKDTSAEMKRREEKLKEIDRETDPEKKKTLQILYDEEERRIRMKSVGNSRFIGELYKLKMLTSNIMHQCIARLLNEGDEESLECLCKLLTTVGRGFESKEAAEKDKDGKKNEGYQQFNNYFKKLAEIAKNKGSKKVSSRVRFMIQDLIDLRKNKWVPRRDDTNPKTIGEIQKEAERETMEMNLALNSSQDRNKRQDSRNSLDSRKRGGGGGGGSGSTDSSGWKTVQPRPRYVIEPSKLKVEHSEIQAVSLGHHNQFAMWGQGLGGGKSDNKKMPQLGGNIYNIFNDKISQPNSRNSSLKGSSISDKDRVFSSCKSNYDDDGRSSRSGSQQGPDSRSSSRDSISSKHDERSYMNAGKSQTPSKSGAASTPVPTKSPEILQQDSKFLLGEYLNLHELEEAEFSFKELLVHSPAEDLVVYISRAAMEMSGSPAKRAVGKLMNHFLKKNLITKPSLLEGLSGVLLAADDLALDIPRIWTYLAEILVGLFAEDCLMFRELADLLKPRQGSPEVAKLLASFFSSLIAEKKESWVQECWALGHVALSDMIEEKDVENFAKQNKLEFLLEEKDINGVNMDAIKSELCKMIANKTDFDTVTMWIDENVTPDKRSKPEFVRTLMTVLLETSVKKAPPSYQFNTELFSVYEKLILKYTDHAEELELTCLYAVQAFIHKLLFPQGLATKICQYLWDQELIASESFILWLLSKYPKEVEGHAVCVSSLKTFITALTENLSDEES